MNLGNQPAGRRERNASRRLQVLELRKAGASIRSIARTLHIAVATAHRDLWQALDDLAVQQRDKAEPLRQLELERLDRYVLALEPSIARGEPRSILAAVRIMERRSRLLGLDLQEGINSDAAAQAAWMSFLNAHGNGTQNGAPRVYDA